MATAVIFGGPSPEHDVSVLTGLQAVRALRTVGPARALYWSKGGEWFEVEGDLEGADFLDGVPKDAKPLSFLAEPGGGFVRRGGLVGRGRPLEVDRVVNCCHGGPGEDGTLQAALDLAGLAYTGPTAAGAALGMDKLAFGALMRSAGLPTLPRVLLTGSLTEVGFPGPYIVKPRFGGSSIGIELVEDLETARHRLSVNPHLRRGAVLEPYRADLVDIQLAVRSFPALELSAIERPERRSPSSSILGYADKYVAGEGMASAPRELPAKLPPEVAQRVRDAAATVAELCAIRGVGRVDFLYGEGELYVNELNTIPGSLAKHLFVDPPVPFTTLLSDMLAEAEQRPAARYSAEGADGTVLKAAGSIAAKLA